MLNNHILLFYNMYLLFDGNGKVTRDIVKTIVDKPDEVKVEVNESENAIGCSQCWGWRF